MALLQRGLAIGVAAAVLAAAVPPLALFAFNTRTAQPDRLPDGWRLKVNHGTPDIAMVREPQGMVLHMKCRNSSFALERGIDINVGEYPYLTWSWKVSTLPRSGDFRSASTDDQAAQVLVAFADRRVLSYIWDSNAPQGTLESASRIPFVHIWDFVCRSGATQLNQWIPETHNVSEDYRRAYGHPAPQVKGIRLQINTQHTGSYADSYFGDVAFRNTAQ